MSVGPLRRFVGMLGLVALAPTALMLALGRIDPTTAALRALATLLATVLIGRLAGWWVAAMARGYESDAAEETPDDDAPPRRRRTDRKPALS